MDDFLDFMQEFWGIFLGIFVFFFLLWLALWTSAGYKAKFYTQVTGKPMTRTEALWIEPEFTAVPGGEITVKVDK